jgi:photosystem II stability/assembly factor-like uncharacterized protein
MHSLALRVPATGQTYEAYLPIVAQRWVPTVGWAVGDSADGYGTILHTIDGGATWQRQGQPGEVPDANLSSVGAIDAANAWAVGGGVILRTRDGGQTWEEQPLPTGVPANTTLSGVKALDGNTAWAVGTPDMLLETTDGHTWNVMPRGADLDLDYPAFYQDVDASDAAHVWAVGGSGPQGRGETVIAFYDGVEWHRQRIEPRPSPPTDALIGVSVLDQDTVWVVGGPGLSLVKTTNGGASWQQVGPVLHADDTNRVVAVTASMGWISGDYGNILRTDDGGQSWSKQAAGATGSFLLAITAADTQRAWTVGPPYWGSKHPHTGVMLRTGDGQNWEKRLAPVEAGLSGISFVGARR